MTATLKVAFLHPDLGLGGAERWLLDTALGLRDHGHRVVIHTRVRPGQRVFEAMLDGRLEVRLTHGVPDQLAGRLRAPLAVLHMAHMARAMARDRMRPDVVVVDLVAHVVPLIRRLLPAPVVYYCHFPDRRLAPRTRGFYRPYRWLMDRFERRGFAAADLLLANSRHTAGVLHGVLAAPRPIEVMTPAIDPQPYAGIGPPAADPCAAQGPVLLLSINRFERGKGLERALEALGVLRTLLDPDLFRRLQLTFAGGLDPARREQIAVLESLRQRAAALGLRGQVTFAPSCSDAERLALMGAASAIVYTPSGEHFGLVPLEAMAAARPLVAVADGGLMETVIDGHTGLLCAPDSEAFAHALARILTVRGLARSLGIQGRHHVQRRFSLTVRSTEWDERLRRLCRRDAGLQSRPRAGKPE